MKYLNSVSFLALLTTMLLMGIGAVHAQADLSEADSEADLQPSGNHCVGLIEPVQPGQTASVVEEVGCFETFAEAIATATGGKVNLPSTTQPTEVTEEMLASAGVTLIAIDYWDSNYNGRSFRWYSHAGGCTSSRYFEADSMPRGWNDEVSSTKGYGGCSRNILYEHINQGGALRICEPNCYRLGAMNDKTSSRRWLR
jgi:hypothetical protein